MLLVNNSIMYYSYHNIIKRKIKDGMLIKYELLDKYNHIDNALVLYFNDGSQYPIREYRHFEYFILINIYFNNVEK